MNSRRSPRVKPAFVSPSVTYVPNFPSLATTGRLLTGSLPNSFSGGFAGPRRPKTRGSASFANAASIVIEKIWSSLSSVRLSLPLVMYGPYRPFCAVIISPSVISAPTVRGNDKSCNASVIVTFSIAIDLNNETIFGFSKSGGGVSIVPHCTYGP